MTRAMTLRRLQCFLFVAMLCGCHPNEERGAWTIVKQRGHENYGFVTEMGTGFVIAGYTNKASSIAAMEEHRENVRRPKKSAKPKEDSLWESVK